MTTRTHGPAPTDGDPPTARCKRCKVPLPDATWKNCDRCRKIRTESYIRWKKSVEERTRMNVVNPSGPSLPSDAHSSSAPATDVAPKSARHGTSSQVPGPIAPNQLPSKRNPNGLPTGDPRPQAATSEQPQWTSASAIPTDSLHITEFQYSDELVDCLSQLRPRSTFLGKFSVVADPEVGNASRAYMFAEQLRARGLAMSYVRQSSFVHLSPSSSPASRVATLTRVRVCVAGKIQDRVRSKVATLPTCTRSFICADVKKRVPAG